MAVCNLFNKLVRPTGTYLTFSQYSEDMSKMNAHPSIYRVVPSKFIALDINYGTDELKKLDNGDLNRAVPHFLQNRFENGCARGREFFKDKWEPRMARNLFWRELIGADLLTVYEQKFNHQPVKYCPQMVCYEPIDTQVYNRHDGMGFDEIYCYIQPNTQKSRIGVALKDQDLFTKGCTCTEYMNLEVKEGIEAWEQQIKDGTFDVDEIYEADSEKYDGQNHCKKCDCDSYSHAEVAEGINNGEQPVPEYAVRNEINPYNCEPEQNLDVEKAVAGWEQDVIRLANGEDIDTYRINFEELYRIKCRRERNAGYIYKTESEHVLGYDNQEVLGPDASNITVDPEDKYLVSDVCEFAFENDGLPVLPYEGINKFEFNTIIVLYDVYAVREDGKFEMISADIPAGMYITGLINEDGTVQNKVTKFSSSEDIFGMGTSYALRIANRFTPVPENGILNDIKLEDSMSKGYESFSTLLGMMAKNLKKMDKLICSQYNNLQFNKDMYAIFKNSRTNVPYTKELNGTDYWFVNGRNTHVKAEGKDGISSIISIGQNGNWFINGLDTGYRSAGIDGTTPQIKNKTWWIGDEDTGIPAIGHDGDTPIIGENGNWWISGHDTGKFANYQPIVTPDFEWEPETFIERIAPDQDITIKDEE